MPRTISLVCPHCGKHQLVQESDLQSGMPLKDDAGNVVQEALPVVVDENTLIACEQCRYPIQCSEANATIK